MSTYTKSLGAVAVLKCIAMESAKNGTSVLPKDIVAAHDALVELIEKALTCVVHAENLRDGVPCRNEQETARVAIDVRALRDAIARVQGGVK